MAVLESLAISDLASLYHGRPQPEPTPLLPEILPQKALASPAPAPQQPAANPLTDLGNLALRGYAATAQGVNWLIGSESGQDYWRGVSQDAAQALSPEQQAASQKEFVHQKDPNAPWYDLSNYEAGPALRDWRSYTGALAESAPGTIMSMGVGGPLTKGLTAVGGRLLPLAEKGMNRLAMGAGAVGYGTGEGLVAGTTNATQARDEVLNRPVEQLAQTSDLYRQQIASGLPPDAARKAVADAVANQVGWESGLTVGLTGAPMGALMGKWFHGGGLGSSRTAGILHGMAGEAGQETLQSGAERYIQNVAERDYVDPNRPLGEGVANAAIAGGISGGLMGGGIASVAPGQRASSPVAGPATETTAPQAEPETASTEPTVPQADSTTPPSPTAIDPTAGPISRAAVQSPSAAQLTEAADGQQQINEATQNPDPGRPEPAIRKEIGSQPDSQPVLSERAAAQPGPETVAASGQPIQLQRGQSIELSPQRGQQTARPTVSAEEQARLAEKMGARPKRNPRADSVAPSPSEAASQPQPEINRDQRSQEGQAQAAPLLDVPHQLANLRTEEIPLDRLRLSEDVPQFKSGANAAGVVDPLGGKYERTGTAPIVVWERADGRQEVISGRHRLDLARRSGEQSIPAQVLREADGFTADKAAMLDAELNIRDNQGQVKDYVQYFQGNGITPGEAESRGLLARETGKRAYTIAHGGTESLLAVHRADQLSDDAAYRISSAAPGNERLQAVGIKAVQDGKSAAHAVNLMQAIGSLAAARGVSSDSTTDLFGFDDSALKEAEQMARIAGREQRRLSERLAAIQGAAKRPELARQEGVNVNDPGALRAKIAEIKQARDAWERWSTNPDLVAQIREQMPFSPKDVRHSRNSLLSSDAKPAGMPVERVQAIADEFLRGLNVGEKANLEVLTKRAVSDFFDPRRIDGELSRSRGFFLPAIAGADPGSARGRNTVGIVASAYPAENRGGRAEVERTLRHEILAHYGINLLEPQAKRQLLDRLIASKNRPGLRELAQAVERDYADQSVDMRAEELFARAAEELSDSKPSKAWDRITFWLTVQLRKIGLFKGKITRAEVNMALRDIADSIRRGAQQRTFPMQRDAQFSRAAAWANDLPPEVRDMASKIGADPKPLTERVAEMKGTLATRLRQGLVDRFARLADLDRKRFGTDFMDTDTALSAWVAAKMSKSPEGALEAAFLHGRLVWDEGALNVKETNKGLVKALEPVAQAGEMNRFWQWIIAHRAERLAAEGREHLFTPAEIQAGKQLNQGQMADGKSRAAIYQQTFNRYRGIQTSILDIAQQAGLFNAAQRAQWEHDFYLPFYRVIEDEGEVRGPTAGGKLIRQKAFEKLKGGTEKLGDPLQNILKNWFHLIDASLKNRAATLALDTAAHLGIAQPVTDALTDKTSVWVMKDGQKVQYNVADPLTLEAISAISAPPLSGWAIKALAATKRALTLGTTISPAFKARNLLRDSIAALAVSKLSPNAFGNVARGFKAAKEGSATQAALLAGGGIFRFGTLLEGDRDAATKRIAGFKPDTILDSQEKIQGVFALMKKGLEGWNRFGDRLESANRAALYQQQRTAGKTHLQASLAARDLMDFAQSGGWGATRFLITAVPFLNARIQGMDVLYRKGFKPLAKTVVGQGSQAEKQQATRFAMTTFMVSLASVALYLIFKDDEDFKKREQWDRDMYWWFKIPGIDQPLRIPKPFEIGAMGTLAERLAEQLCDPEAGGELFIERMGAMLTQTFAFDPTPQLFKPLLEIAANKSSFTQRPIETLDMERLSPEMRKRYNTSALAAGLSQAGLGKMGLSPVQVEHLIRGYFGWIGAQALLLGDMAARPALGLPEKPQKLKDAPIFGDLLNTFAPDGRSSRYVTEFYSQLQQIRQLHADAKLMQKLGDTGLSGFVQDHRKELALAAPMERAARTMAEFGKMERRIAEDRTLSGQEKQAKIDQISERKQQMAKRLRTALAH